MPSMEPINVCSAETCGDCRVRPGLHCHFNLKELIHFYLLSFPPILIGGRGALALGWGWLVLYIAIIIGFFGFLEIRVMCAHCPHYAEDGGKLRCWANYGSPKLWAYRPGPMSLIEKILFYLGLIVVAGFPVGVLVSAASWFDLILYLITLGGFGATLKVFLCSQCMNFACPLNTVDDEVRKLFFENCPSVAEAWGRPVKQG